MNVYEKLLCHKCAFLYSSLKAMKDLLITRDLQKITNKTKTNELVDNEFFCYCFIQF